MIFFPHINNLDWCPRNKDEKTADVMKKKIEMIRTQSHIGQVLDRILMEFEADFIHDHELQDKKKVA